MMMLCLPGARPTPVTVDCTNSEAEHNRGVLLEGTFLVFSEKCAVECSNVLEYLLKKCCCVQARSCSQEPPLYCREPDVCATSSDSNTVTHLLLNGAEHTVLGGRTTEYSARQSGREQRNSLLRDISEA